MYMCVHACRVITWDTRLSCVMEPHDLIRYLGRLLPIASSRRTTVSAVLLVFLWVILSVCVVILVRLKRSVRFRRLCRDGGAE